MNKKISELDPAASLTGTEELPIIQSSTTVKTTVQDIANIAILEIPPINTSSLQEVTDEGSTTTNTIYTFSPVVSDTSFIGLEVFDSDVNFHRMRPTSFVYDGEEGDITLSYEYPLASYNLTIPAKNGTLAVYDTGQGLVLQTNQPSNPLTGSIYFDSSSAQLKVWNGGWVSIS
jgi:hypothetical protein